MSIWLEHLPKQMMSKLDTWTRLQDWKELLDREVCVRSRYYTYMLYGLAHPHPRIPSSTSKQTNE